MPNIGLYLKGAVEEQLMRELLVGDPAWDVDSRAICRTLPRDANVGFVKLDEALRPSNLHQLSTQAVDLSAKLNLDDSGLHSGLHAIHDSGLP